MPVGLGQQDGRRWLEVRGQARVRRGLDVDRPEACAVEGGAVDLDGVRAAGHVDAGPADDLEERAEVLARRAVERDPATGHGRGDDERAGLDPVGHDPVLGAAQSVAALDLDRVGRGPFDVGAHVLEEQR